MGDRLRSSCSETFHTTWNICLFHHQNFTTELVGNLIVALLYSNPWLVVSSKSQLAGAPYVVRPARPRSYLDFEKQKAAAHRHYRGLTWFGRARHAGVAPVKTKILTIQFSRNINFAGNSSFETRTYSC